MDLTKAALTLVLGLFVLMVISVLRTSFFGAVEPGTYIYFEIVFLLLLAVVGELAVAYLKLPSVMILLILGILISPSFLSLSWEALQSAGLPLPHEPPNILRLADVIQVFAQLGAVILLFKVGLQNKIESIFSKDNLVVAAAGVALPFVVGYGYAVVSGGNFAYSMFLGAALTATSVGVTVALLKDLGLLSERFAQVIVGAAVIDDVLGLLVLSFVINTTTGDGSLVPVIITFISAVVFIFGSIIVGGYMLRYIDRNKMSQSLFMLVIAFVLLYAYVAEFIKLSAIVGAFIAGVILNRSRHNADIEEKTYGLEVLFVPIFFISLGTLVDVKALYYFLVPIVVLSVLAIVSKVVACSAASLARGLKPKDALAVGIGMSPRGEVALIVASLGLSSGVLNSSEYSVISVMALLTTIAVPPLLGRILTK